MAKQTHIRPSSPGKPILPADLHVTQDSTRSPMARASDGRPFKPYEWHGIPGPVIGTPIWKNGTQVGTVHAGDDEMATATGPDGIVHHLDGDMTRCGLNAVGWSRHVTDLQLAGLVIFCEACE